MWSSPSHGHSVDTQGKGDWEKKHSDKSLLLASLLLLVTPWCRPQSLAPRRRAEWGRVFEDKEAVSTMVHLNIK